MRTCVACNITYEGDEAGPCPRCGRLPHAAPQAAWGHVSDVSSVLKCPACAAVFSGRPGDACPRCGARIGERAGLPWQDRRTKGLSAFRAIWRTVRAVHRHPYEAFADMQSDQLAAEADHFFIASFVAVGILRALAVLVAGLVAIPFTPHKLDWATAGIGLTIVGANLILVFVAVDIIFVYHMAASVARWVMRVLHAGDRPVGDIVAVFEYGPGSTYLWAAFPVIGWLLSFAATCVIAPNALAALYGVGYGKAWAAATPLIAGVLLAHAIAALLSVGVAGLALMALNS